jgi:hypothetical protein
MQENSSIFMDTIKTKITYIPIFAWSIKKRLTKIKIFLVVKHTSATTHIQEQQQYTQSLGVVYLCVHAHKLINQYVVSTILVMGKGRTLGLTNIMC